MKLEINKTSFKDAIKFLEKDDILGKYVKNIEPPKININEDYFFSLCRYIIFQQLSIKSASATFSRFTNLLNNNISAEQVLKQTEIKLKNTGMSFKKVEYLRILSQSFIDNSSYEDLEKMSNDDIIKTLSSIKGIGTWTAEMFLIFTMGRIDVFSNKDIGLLNAIKIIYNFEVRPNFDEADKLAKRWSPYRTIASLYLWKILEGEDFDW